MNRHLFVISVALAALSAQAQSVTLQFAGNRGTMNAATGKPTYRDHPDMTSAANGTQVVAVDGEQVIVYSYAARC